MKTAFLLAGPRKLWLASVLAAVVVIAALFASIFAVLYLRTNWQILNETQRELVNLEKRRAEIAAAADVRGRLSGEEKLIRASFVDASGPLPFIESIEALGRRSGVKTELTLGSGSADANQVYVLKATGTFLGTMYFFQNLESLPFLIQTGDTEITLSEDMESRIKAAPSESAVRLTLTLRIISP